MMAEPIPYTIEDRAMLRDVRDALLGTFEHPGGLLTEIAVVERKIDGHIANTHVTAMVVAEMATNAARAVAAQAVDVAAELARNERSMRRFVYDAAKYAIGSVLALLATGAVATFWLGLKLSINY